jgi:uncharacterized protein (TIGR03435 family)
MKDFAQSLERSLKTTVADRTGLQGFWDVDVIYARETASLASLDAPATTGEFPNFFYAIQEQLGLELAARRGSVPAFTIASVQLPAGN